MFYRQDIMEELGLQIPETWDDVYDLIPELQKRNLDFGLPWVQIAPGSFEVQPVNAAYAMFLFQTDGRFYRDDGREMALDEEQAIRAFERWSQFYSAYKLPIEYSLWQRLRTGEMPIGIGYFNLYNVLTVSAPELRGLWTFGPVPGTRQPDGTIERAVSSDVKAVMIVEQSDQPEEAWEYLKWWTSIDAQTGFGREMVTVLGPAGRWETANLEAFSRMSWPIDVIRSLNLQRESVRGVPEVPGGYFTGRHLENAFREVVFEGFSPRDTLLNYVDVMNEEIRSKRKEFGLD
jgi:ABC-type glycerol-3-phosphate transport system substrate-binding protein